MDLLTLDELETIWNILELESLAEEKGYGEAEDRGANLTKLSEKVMAIRNQLLSQPGQDSYDNLTLDREINDRIDKLESLLVLAYQDDSLTHHQQMNIAENLDILATEFSDIVHESFEAMDDERKEFWSIPKLYNASIIIDGALDEEEGFYDIDSAIKWLDDKALELSSERSADMEDGKAIWSEALLAVYDTFECQNVHTIEMRPGE